MSAPPVRKSLAILAHVGNGNLGDEATVAALVQNIRARRPDADIHVFSSNPADTESRHHVPALPLQRLVAQRFRASSEISTAVAAPSRDGLAGTLKRWLKGVPTVYRGLKALERAARFGVSLGPELRFLLASFRALRKMDRVIIAGGGQLGDYFGGPWGYPFTTLRWCLTARLAGARVVFASVGAEPITSPISKRFFRWALALADYRSFRDEGSRQLIQGLGVPGELPVCPDLVHGFRLPGRDAAPRRPGGGLTVGINPIPFFDPRYWTEHDEAVYERYVKTLASFALWLIEAGHRVVFFPTQVHADPPVIADVELAMRKAASTDYEEHVLRPSVHTFEDLAAVLQTTDLVVASRFHGIIFSYLLNVPVVGLSYYRKMDEIMAAMGQGEYVMSIRGADLEALKVRFTSLAGDLERHRAAIAGRRAEYQQALDAQYPRLLG